MAEWFAKPQILYAVIAYCLKIVSSGKNFGRSGYRRLLDKVIMSGIPPFMVSPSTSFPSGLSLQGEGRINKVEPLAGNPIYKNLSY